MPKRDLKEAIASKREDTREISEDSELLEEELFDEDGNIPDDDEAIVGSNGVTWEDVNAEDGSID